MLRFSDDPRVAEREMQAIIFHLTTFGHVDGEFDGDERRFVEDFIEGLVRGRVTAAREDAPDAVQAELTERYTRHFHGVLDAVDRQVRELLQEGVATGESESGFVMARLKVRCVEIMAGFDRRSRETLYEALAEMMEADGAVHPAEAAFLEELATLVEGSVVGPVEDLGFLPGLKVEPLDLGRPTLEVRDVTLRPPPSVSPAFFDALERHYAFDSIHMLRQLAEDRDLIDEALGVLAELRRRGEGRLRGKRTVEELRDEGPFLDEHVHWCPPRPDPGYDVTVLGDLHGCYSCLKAAVVQSRFFEKLDAWRLCPDEHPEPRMVLLGDYIDRGRFSLDGVLRGALQLLCRAPSHVHVLRGNHEYFLDHEGEVYSGVAPAESVEALKPHVSPAVFRHYIRLFEALPTSLLFGRTLFVHGGIPRDHIVREEWLDLSTLNDPDVRFQMMWSDPSPVEHIPPELQEQTARFPFGRLQARAFLRRIGCRAIVRGHEKVVEGFRRVWDEPDVQLFTLFSAGGAGNADLPPESSYRNVTPMALTIRALGDEMRVSPWRIAWEGFNGPERNGFYRDVTVPPPPM